MHKFDLKVKATSRIHPLPLNTYLTDLLLEYLKHEPSVSLTVLVDEESEDHQVICLGTEAKHLLDSYNLLESKA